MSIQILALVGSLRSASVNRKLAEAAAALAPEGTEVTIYEGLAEVPFYNEDLDAEGSVPAAAQALRDAAKAAGALLLVTPEYNGSTPAVLSNAVDWLSRPYGAGAVKDLPAAVISASPSPYGAKWANDDARKVLGVAGAKVLEDASVTVGGRFQDFAETHPKDHEETAAELAGVLAALIGALEPVNA
ncbi:NAD(P)H-dependent oxidoreductase [Arthrobacter sp. I2-34]|uniref:NAD(P)H-dependent oxidoreductase n=1 Tax=Arthrobacter hankyongi TaxID=2904801 RepID=A0ABS9L645_9MICC|nr:NADPH-dependent FMN reductase [Arthrobacter hankyongi]MCG2621952.1 NAD(P)H-dependent oxidoreductase [Arthrobacter hankyongi]